MGDELSIKRLRAIGGKWRAERLCPGYYCYICRLPSGKKMRVQSYYQYFMSDHGLLEQTAPRVRVFVGGEEVPGHWEGSVKQVLQENA